MKKGIISLIIVISLIVVLYLINSTRQKESDEKLLTNYLEESGYILDKQNFINPLTGEEQNSGVYHKLISDKDLDEYLEDVKNNTNSRYEELFFNADSYQLVKVVMNYEDEVSTVFKAEKQLHKKIVSYNYELSILSSSIVLNGTYKTTDVAFDNKNLSCSVLYTVRMDEEEKDTYCNISKYELLSFLEDINNFTDSQEIKAIIDKGPK